MKKYLINCLLTTCLILFILSLIRKTLPFYWAGKVRDTQILVPKFNYLKENQEINTLFIGSSQIRHHIIPEIIDKETGLNSFNLGLNGMFFLESSFILENLLDENISENIEYIFLELSPHNNILDKNLHSARSKYFLDYRRFSLGLNNFLSEKKHRQAFNLVTHYIGNQFLIGNLNDAVVYQKRDKHINKVANKGYSPLFNSRINRKNLPACNSRNYILDTYETETTGLEFDRLRKLCEKKGIKLFAFYTNDKYYCFSSDIKNDLISLGSFAHYDDYADEKLWWNQHHLNNEGAIVFSEKMGVYINTLLKN